MELKLTIFSSETRISHRSGPVNPMVGFVGAQYPNSPLPSRNIPRYLRGTEIGWGVPSFRRLVKNNRTGRKSECRRANRTDRTCSRVGKIFLPKPDFRLRHESSILPLVSPAFLPHRLSPPDFRVPILSHGERIPPDLGKRKRAYDLEADLEGKEEANLPDGNCSTDS